MPPAIEKFLKKIEPPKWVLILLVICFILRIPSFFEPYYYGDEMIYLTLGQGIRQGIPLYLGLHDNKPPLLYIFAAIAGNLFWFKVILALWSTFTIVFFWKLSQALLPKNNKAIKAATIIFSLLTTIPLIEGNTANAELFFIGPIIFGFWILLTKRLSKKNVFFAGLSFSVATLFKVPAMFDMAAVVFLWLVTIKKDKKGIKEFITNVLWLAIGFLTPLLLTVVWYFLRGALKEYLVAAFLQNLGYLSSWKNQATQQLPFWVKNKSLLIRAAIVAVGLGLLAIKRKKLPTYFIFTSSWLLISLFAVALSERPYPHYLIQAIPSISILFGLLLADKTLVQVYSIIPLTLAFLVPVYFKFWTYPTFSYYQRFLKFAVRIETQDEYFSNFRQQILRNYQIAKTVRSLTQREERVFVWGDDSSIYALSRRLPPIKYVADYHVKDFSTPKEIVLALTNNPPTIIVILPEGSAFVEIKPLLRQKYILLSNIDGAEIFKLINLNPTALQSLEK